MTADDVMQALVVSLAVGLALGLFFEFGKGR